MKDIVWGQVLSVEVDEIDEGSPQTGGYIQHPQSCDGGKCRPDLPGGGAEELINCTVWHFSHEERLMLNGYPEMPAHKAVHQQLISGAKALQAKIVQADNRIVDEGYRVSGALADRAHPHRRYAPGGLSRPTWCRRFEAIDPASGIEHRIARWRVCGVPSAFPSEDIACQVLVLGQFAQDVLGLLVDLPGDLGDALDAVGGEFESAPSVFPSAPGTARSARRPARSGCARSRRRQRGSSTRIGRRPCSSGIRSDGLLRWNAPEAMNRMWSVLTMPCLVDTVQPSTSGSRSRCTPSRDTSAPCCSLRLVTLSSSSRNTMPCCSTISSARSLRSSSLTRLAASSSRICSSASLIAACASLRWPPRFWNRPPQLAGHLFHARRGHDLDAAWRRWSRSRSPLSSSSPLRNLLAELVAGRYRRCAQAPRPPPSCWCCAVAAAAHRARVLRRPRSGDVLHLVHLLHAHHLDRGVGQVADDRIDIAADVADLGELGRLDLDERRVGQPGGARSRSCRRRSGRSSGCSSA